MQKKAKKRNYVNNIDGTYGSARCAITIVLARWATQVSRNSGFNVSPNVRLKFLSCTGQSGESVPTEHQVVVADEAQDECEVPDGKGRVDVVAMMTEIVCRCQASEH